MLTFSSDLQIKAFLGDLRHKRDVVLLLDDIPSSLPYFTNSHQANYIRDKHPGLLPPPQNGHAPSNHAIATVFEYTYADHVDFRASYITWLVGNRGGIREPVSA